MITAEEQKFVDYWQANRLKKKKVQYSLAVAMPGGCFIGIGILLNYYSGWFTRANMEGNSKLSPVVLLIALLCIVIFMAVFSVKFNWDQKEQLYLELLSKKNKNRSETKTDAANNKTNSSNN